MVSPPQSPEPRQASLRRLRRFGVLPDHSLGQNFLIDSNLLTVISQMAEVGPADVVLEVGGGLGVLSEHLAARAGHVHVVEVDRRLEPALGEALDPFAGRTTLHLADAMRLDFSALAPPPDKVVANLPYGIAGSLILRTVLELPGARRWVVMVQREVGERLAAAPGGPAYGAPSVIAQLACEVRVLRPVSRSVFRPIPRVDSVLLGLVRTGPPPAPALVELVHAGFAHRRKALSGSLALAPGARRGVRQAARRALGCIGLPADARAERLAPAAWLALAEELEAHR